MMKPMQLCIAFALLVLQAPGAEGLSLRKSGTKREGKGFFGIQFYDIVIGPPKCDCACCRMAPRRQGEIDGSTTAKCAAPLKGTLPAGVAKLCGDATDRTICSVINDSIFASATTVRLERFCFYKCVPAGCSTPAEKVALNNADVMKFGGGNLVDTACEPIPTTNLGDAIASDGNGRDAGVPAANCGTDA